MQTSFAPPIVSDEANFLTKLFSSFIFMTEKAKDIVTASGRPSGTAITMTVTPRMKASMKALINFLASNLSTSSLKKAVRRIRPLARKKASRAKMTPYLASEFAIDSSFC